MTNQHPITPPDELLRSWENRHFDEEENLDLLLIEAYQAGADQELEEFCAEVIWLEGSALAAKLRDRRRPKPPSLKEQALTALHAVATGANDTREQHQDLDTIRKALEALSND
jgi:hypothetical protein